MMIGVYGLIFEFMNPGVFFPGVIGAICLLTGLYGVAVLPLNYAGLGLMLLGVVLMVAEMFTPSVGALGIGGEIGRASCRGRVWQYGEISVVGVSLTKKKNEFSDASTHKHDVHTIIQTRHLTHYSVTECPTAAKVVVSLYILR